MDRLEQSECGYGKNVVAPVCFFTILMKADSANGVGCEEFKVL